MNTVTYPTPAEIQAIEAKARQLRAETMRAMFAGLRRRIVEALHIGGAAQHG